MLKTSFLVVVPCYKEEEAARELNRRVTALCCACLIRHSSLRTASAC